MDLAELISKNAEKYAEKEIRFDQQVLNYAQLWERAANLCRSLQRLGIEPGDRIAIQLPKRLEFLYTYLANLQLGSVLVPLNNTYTREEMSYFLADSGARALVTDDEHAMLLGASRKEFPSLEHLILLDPEKSTPDSVKKETETAVIRFNSLLERGNQGKHYSPQPGEVTLIIYTSGTTGRSKGAMLTRGNLNTNLESLRQAWGHSDRDILLHTLPIFHVHGLLVAFTGALHSGMGIVMRSRFEPLDVLECIEKYRCTVFMGVPTMYQRLMQVDEPRRFNISSMRLWVSGSAPLTAATFERFQKVYGSTILERYGMSETGMNVSNPLEGVRKPGSVGLPLPGVDLRVVDSEGKDAATGEVGEVWIKGDNVFQGYWQMPEKTSESFVSGWFKTGDLGYRDQEGYLYLVSRARDLIISGGLNVYPKEIEALIETLEAVEESAVIGVPDDDLGERVVAVVVPKPGQHLEKGEIESLCRGNLAGYKRPKSIHLVEALPKNTMGKVMKNVLREEYRVKQ